MLVKAMVVKTQARRVLSRPRTLLPTVVVFLLLCFLGLVHHDRMSQRAELERLRALERDPGKNQRAWLFC
jgi:hypothetical protein